MENANPYSSPQSNLFGGTSASGGDGVTQGVILQLQKTRPWVRFIAVLMFIISALMLLAGVLMGAFGATGGFKPAGGGSAAFNAGFGVGMAALYAFIAVLYMYPALKLWKYADRIRDLVNSRQGIDLEKALNEQRAFWKFVGVMIIVLLVLYFFIFVAAIGFGVFTTMTKAGHG